MPSTPHDTASVAVLPIENGTGYADSPYVAVLTVATDQPQVALTMDDLDRLILDATATRHFILEGDGA